ncbi:hypothetical protein LXM94_20870 [Rhizobium sp. TRM95111]|uniref:calcium-binding protein n=1 Tax=Rhizobium alarense TaxID=2846851 RepID=UPI001F1A8B3B|nr:hypothetical protein [Rhizobium alarense]MCF3642426.1 hypothetical protein [Rhizobium alarense]
MATFKFKGFTAKSGMDFDELTGEDLDTILDYDNATGTSTSLKLFDDSRNVMTFKGKGFDYKFNGQGEVIGFTSGTIGSFKVVSDGITVVDAAKLGLSATALTKVIDSNSTAAFFAELLAGNDTVTATAFHDDIWSGAGNDVVNGLAGNDTLAGNAGDDTLKGAAGKDQLFGGADDDGLRGGSGADILDGGEGDDVLAGGSGTDTFVFAIGYGADRIKDFKATGTGHDILDLSEVASVRSFDDLIADHVSVESGSVVIDLGGGDTIVLNKVKLAALDAGDFLF